MNSIIFTFIIMFLEIYLTKDIKYFLKGMNRNETNDITTLTTYLNILKENIVERVESEDILIYLKLAIELNFMTYFDEEKIFFYLKNSIRFEKFPLRYINDKLVFETEKKKRNNDFFVNKKINKINDGSDITGNIVENKENKQLIRDFEIAEKAEKTDIETNKENNNINTLTVKCLKPTEDIHEVNNHEVNQEDSNGIESNKIDSCQNKDCISIDQLNAIIKFHDYNSFQDGINHKIVIYITNIL